MLEARNKERLEELRSSSFAAKRSIPTELTAHANFERFARVQEAEHEQRLVRELEEWMFPSIAAATSMFPQGHA